MPTKKGVRPDALFSPITNAKPSGRPRACRTVFACLFAAVQQLIEFFLRHGAVEDVALYEIAAHPL